MFSSRSTKSLVLEAQMTQASRGIPFLHLGSQYLSPSSPAAESELLELSCIGREYNHEGMVHEFDVACLCSMISASTQIRSFPMLSGSVQICAETQ